MCQAGESSVLYFLKHNRWTHYFPKLSWGRNSGTWLFYKIQVTASLEKQLPGNSEQRIVFRFLWNLVYLFWFFCWAHFPPYNPQTEQFWRKNSTHKKPFFLQKVFLRSTAIFTQLNRSIFRTGTWTHKKRKRKCINT